MTYYFNDSNLNYLTYNPSTLEMVVHLASGSSIRLLNVLDKHFYGITECEEPYDYFNDVLLNDDSVNRGYL